MASISSRKFIVESEDPSEYTPRAARRVTLNADVIKAAKLSTGDIVVIAGGDSNASSKNFAVGVVWPSLKLPQDAVLLPTSLRLTARLETSQKARIFPLSGSSSNLPFGLPVARAFRKAGTIQVLEICPADHLPRSSHSKEHEKQREWLKLLLKELLVDIKYVTCEQILEISFEGRRRKFSVESITSRDSKQPAAVEDVAKNFENLSIASPRQVWTIGWDANVTILHDKEFDPPQAVHKPEIEILQSTPANQAYSTVGGLDKQIQEVRDLLEIPLTHPELFRHFGLRPPRGILLHGPPGTGKTHLARAIASSTNSAVLVINGPELSSAYHGETESKLRDVFREARERSPCIVVLDEVDALVPRREESAGGEVEKRVVATLLTILDGMEETEAGEEGRVVVIGTTNRPNAIDPALRRPGRFDREIEIGIPDAEARLSILNVLLAKIPHSIPQGDLRALATRAYGYVGADLSAVVREAGTVAIKRWLASPEGQANPALASTRLKLTLDDLASAMPSIRPSAMRSLFLDTPPIRYSDIGGQAAVIQKLREAVEWPLLHPEAFKRLGVKPPKGVLLYGPPGCSKTVLARACACESGVNFVAVKGPELLNKFVGESERAVREIFRKARAASPSIIFFDEIDALATSRSSGDGDGTASHEGVLTSLLNEMDGVQELIGVTVVAATNRPEAIDSALMRPGRLDRILYVGPPDQAGREEILKIKMRTMTVEPDIDITEIARLTDGCSGAEITALCQEAAILTMQKNMTAPYVPHEAFVAAARGIKKQITPSVLEKFQSWTKSSQVRVV